MFVQENKIESDESLPPKNGDHQSLIQTCGFCGSHSFGSPKLVNMIPVKRCNGCGVLAYEINFTEYEYKNFYQTYDEFLESTNRPAYRSRYEHDRKIAEIRFRRHTEILDGLWCPPSLDIGCSNGAHVDFQNEKNFFTIGNDIRKDIYGGTNPFIPGDIEDEEVRKEIINVLRKKQENWSAFNTITLYDVFEHLTRPRDFLRNVQKLLSRNGVLIIDVPDFYHEKGKHHWKPYEHLYYFTDEQIENLFRKEGFWITAKDKPIPGKIVYYLIRYNI